MTQLQEDRAVAPGADEATPVLEVEGLEVGYRTRDGQV